MNSNVMWRKKEYKVLGLDPQMDEEGQMVQPTKPKASLTLSKDQKCMVSGIATTQ